jgi:exopolysaccharide biosynthesis polyprenyl glycosylphosphotransferase
MALATSALSPLDSAPRDGAADVSSTQKPAPAALAALARPLPAARLVAAADVALVMGALLMAFLSGSSEGWVTALGTVPAARIHVYEAVMVVAFGAATLLVFESLGLYDAARLRRSHEEVARVLVATMAVTALASIVTAATHPSLITADTRLRFWAGSFAAIALMRAVRARLVRTVASHHRRILIVGSGPHARRICRELSVDPLIRYQILGFVDTDDASRSPYVARRTLGTIEGLESILVREHVDEVHVGLPVKSHYPQIQKTIRVCERIGVKVMYGADIFGTELARPRVDRDAGRRPRVELQVVADGWPLAVKRLVDIGGAICALVVLSPLMLVAALAVKLTSEGPAVYTQERYGLNRRRFRMMKFRTMVRDADRLQAQVEALNEAQGPVFKIGNDPRLTSIGRWLRRTSIDELPQLFNVLAGDMSLVGPRPLPVRDVALITRSDDMRRFSVRPGVTGLWQISGRSNLGFDRWIALDLHYIDHWSLRLDAAILARTIPAVVRGTGAA